jgi:hypothetical protein
MFGFIEIGGFVFGEKSAVVIDPTEEKLKSEFQEVKRTYVPMHSVIRIDEVKQEGVAKITSMEGKPDQVVSFPGSYYSPPNKPKGDS